MRKRLTLSLQAKITFVIAAACLVAILSIIYFCISYQRKYLIEQFETSTNCLIDAVSGAILYPMSVGDQKAIKQQMNEFRKNQKNFDIYIFGCNKKVVFTTQPKATMTDLSRTISSAPLSHALDNLVTDGTIPGREFDEQIDGKHYMTTLRPLFNEKRCQHCHGASNPIRGGIMIRQRSDAFLADLKSLRDISILIGLGGCGAVILLLYFLIFRLAVRPLTTIINGLKGVSEVMANSSFELSSLGQHLAEGASEQAAAIAETSSSIEEVATTTRQNTENTGQASQLTTEANQIIENVNQSIEDLTSSMEEISKASLDTQKIIKTIEKIAFQTNLLALNAAVEAARANEAGAGFAVVAEEVRNLAIRATEAAKDTAVIIESTAKRVEAGSALTAKAHGEFRQVSTIVAKSAELVGQITAASHQQDRGIEQINKAVIELDHVAQQNTANAEESAAVSEEISAQAEQVRGVVQSLAILVAGKAIEGPAESRAENSPPRLPR